MNRIAALRKKQKLSQKEFGSIIGVAQNTVCNWENGNREPGFDMALRIADYFHVSVDYLLGRDEKKSPADSEELSAAQQEALQFIKELSDDQLVRFIKLGRAALEMGGGQRTQNTPRREAGG